MASTAEAVGTDSTPTVEVIGTLLVARKRKRVFRRQMSAMEYGVAVRLILSIYRRLYLVSFPSPSVLRMFMGGGDLVRPSSVSRTGRGFKNENLN